MKDGCWKLDPDWAHRWFDQGKEKTNAMISKEPKKFYEIKDSSIVDEKMDCVIFKLQSVVNAEGFSVYT